MYLIARASFNYDWCYSLSIFIYLIIKKLQINNLKISNLTGKGNNLELKSYYEK